ncbi:MAG: MerR family transcriptional regulator, partial [Gemmatimonadota bacterium]|nr:MerR family transcriptional regulator [Gemmatimonadota bacterium]
HHYDEIGLLAPAERTSSGHRLYGETELRRLQEIVSLKSVGLPLREIKEHLLRNETSLDRVLELQVERINQQIAGRKRLLALIQGLRQRLRALNGVTLEELTRTIEVTMKYEKYYTPEQLEQLEEHAGEVGEERIQAVQQEWTELFAAYQASMEKGCEPASDEVQALARKSAALIQEFTGGDETITASLGNMYKAEGGEGISSSHGMNTSPELWEYMGKAGAVLRGDS